MDLKNYSFGAIALDSSCADNFGEQFRGISLGRDNFFPEYF